MPEEKSDLGSKPPASSADSEKPSLNSPSRASTPSKPSDSQVSGKESADSGNQSQNDPSKSATTPEASAETAFKAFPAVQAPSIETASVNAEESAADAPSATSRHRKTRSVSIRRSRNASIALTASMVNGSEAKPAKVFLQSAFEKIRASKDAKRIPALQKAAQRVTEAFAPVNDLPAPKLLLDALRLVCVPPGPSNELKEVALDTLGQLFSLNYFAIADDVPVSGLLGDAVGIVCDAWDAEGADQRVELQIIKALTAAVVNEDSMVHASVLMRAVRQVYHIFVVSRSVMNQSLAQGSLTQMVQAVFERVKMHTADRETEGDADGDAEGDTETEPTNVLDSAHPDQTLTLKDIKSANLPDLEEKLDLKTERENSTQDAGLLFRTLCRLATKAIDESDVRSQQMRSKLLSLHLLHMILKHHISVFKNHGVVVHRNTDVEPLAFAIKPYLVQTMAHNALSPSPAAFEISSEIFWLVLSNLRSEFKPELAVFFTEVYLTAMDMKTATMHQRMYFMTVISRICTDPRLLVELYLNYDCDPAAPNVYERLTDLVSRVALKPATEPVNLIKGSRLSIDRQQIRVYDLNAPPGVAIAQLVNAPVPSASQLASSAEADAYRLKIAALESLVNVLRSLVLWSQRKSSSPPASSDQLPVTDANPELAVDEMANVSGSSQSLLKNDQDDPQQFANRKQNKRLLDAAVQEFNFSASRGIQKFVDAGLLADPTDPKLVAHIFLTTDGLNKAQMGEYLGKSSEFNQNVLTQFVNGMDFHGKRFVEALRDFLQRFRLPGEGQVVDRIMQMFAQKFYDDNSEDGQHSDFQTAGAAWALAVSVMMLNTDLHSAALRRNRMTDVAFIRNNEGLNESGNFRSEFLMDIYQEIKNNEIKLESEQTDVAIRDQTYEVASDAIANRAAQVFKTAPPLEFSNYYNASHAAHIRPMFEISWLAILAGISNPFSQINHDENALVAVLEGLEMALRIACQYDVTLARTSFVQTLAQNTLLSLPTKIQRKNLGALHTLLRVALAEADALRSAWYDVLVIISQLERLQMRAQEHRPVNNVQDAIPTMVKDDLISRELVVALDRIFAETANMTNEGAVYFVKALARVSLEEIQQSDNPQLFALQKMVDVCYYNSARIRMGWSEMWDAAMAEQFAKVLVDKNEKVVMFALDSLRQLSMRFLEIDEMPHFPFQREFLAPFGIAVQQNPTAGAKVMALECLQQIVRTRNDKLKSGWEALFHTAQMAAEIAVPTVLEGAYNLLKAVPVNERVPHGYLDACSSLAEQVEAKTALRAVELLHQLVQSHPHDIPLLQRVLKSFSEIALQGSDLEVRGRCLEILFALLNEQGRQFQREDWNEVFTNCLGPLFSVLHQHSRRHSSRSVITSPTVSPAGSNAQLVMPSEPHSATTTTSAAPQTFNELLTVPNQPPLTPTSATKGNSPSQPWSRSPSPSRGRNTRAREEFSLWLSSTMIQALKSLVALFTTYFDLLEHALDAFFLSLLRTCILQENDAVSRMGNSCLQSLVHDNADRFNDEHWHLIASTFVQLFRDTTATQLMDRQVIEGPGVDAAELFRSMTAKTMQALQLMGSVRELFVVSKAVLEKIPLKEILRITARLQMSHQFAREFNHQHELRQELYQRGFFRQTPNLLHQESQAGQTFISIGMRLFKNTLRFERDPTARQDVAEELIPFCNGILADYNQLKESEPRHVSKFLPIVESILQHVASFDDADFHLYAPPIYLNVISILDKTMTPALRGSVQLIMRRVAEVWVLPPVKNE